jgi:acetyl esterase/lipase
VSQYKTLLSALGILVTIVCLTACGPTQEERDAQATKTAISEIVTQVAEEATLTTDGNKNILYAEVDEKQTKLDVYAPSQQGPWPVVIVGHGYGQNRYEVGDLSQAIASRGAVVYNVDLAITVPFISAIERLACAVRFARDTAGDYGGDPDRITVVGNSGGAAAGVVVGLAGDDFDEGCVVSDLSAIPDALVGYEGPYEFATTNYGGMVDHVIVKRGKPELIDAIDPYSHIGRNPDLQVLLIHGEDEDTAWYEVLPEESIELHQTLAGAGYDVELLIIDGASHGALSSRYTDAFAMVVYEVMELVNGLSQ